MHDFLIEGASRALSFHEDPWLVFREDGEILSESQEMQTVFGKRSSKNIFEVLAAVMPNLKAAIEYKQEIYGSYVASQPVYLGKSQNAGQRVLALLSIHRLFDLHYIAFISTAPEISILENVLKTEKIVSGNGSSMVATIGKDGKIIGYCSNFHAAFVPDGSNLIGYPITTISIPHDKFSLNSVIGSCCRHGQATGRMTAASRSGAVSLLVAMKSLSNDEISISLVRAGDIENARDRLLDLATRDSLTGAFNRRYFMDIATAEILRWNRYGGSVSFLAFDIDHFKVVNDTYGHDSGDLVLKAVCKLIQDTVRSVDILARFGGEEFFVMLPFTSPEDAYVLAERLRKLIEKQSYVAADGRSFSVTTSIGISGPDKEAKSVDAILKNADIALYRAKESGRNKVVLYQS